MPVILGTTGNDEILGTEQDDIINGVAGLDVIYGLGGNDTITGAGRIFGGEGDDTVIITGAADYTLDGGAGRDTLDLSAYFAVTTQLYRFIANASSPNTITAPILTWPSGPNVLAGISISAVNFEVILGADRLGTSINGYAVEYDFSLRTTPIEIRGGRSNDIIYGGSGADILRGGDGNDFITAGLGDQVFGDAGDDLIVARIDVNGGPIRLDGGADYDTLRLSVGADIGRTIDFSVPVSQTSVTGFEIIELSLEGGTNVTEIFGTSGDDNLRISGGSSSLRVYGGSGNDTIAAGGAVVFGGAGDDTLSGSGTLDGGEGNDTFGGFITQTYSVDPRRGFIYNLGPVLYDSVVIGGAGTDTINLVTLNSYNGITSTIAPNLRVSLASGLVEHVSSAGILLPGSIRISSVESVRTGDGSDHITGDAAANRLEAGTGNDVVSGGDGADVIYGEAGDDVLNGDGGDDIIYGGDGDDIIDGGSGNDIIFGGLGIDRVIGGSGDDIIHAGGSGDIDGGDGLDTVVFNTTAESVFFTFENGKAVVVGTFGRLTLTNVESLQFTNDVLRVGADGHIIPPSFSLISGSSGNDLLVGSSQRDNIQGFEGNDILRGGAGSDFLDGGAGIDTAAYEGLARAYGVARGTNNGFASVTGGREGGIDALVSIEKLSFLDGTIDTDSNGATAKIYRLYDAALDRGPDQAGLSGWVGRLGSGTTLAQAAQAFATAPEFVARYGNLSNEDFVKTMYRFSLNREGDTAGVAAWRSQLDTGVSRGDVLLAFSESVEHRNITAAAVSAGLFVQDERTIAVARLYDAAFDRVPDQGGIIYWRGTLETGGSLFAIANAFVSSQEFQDRYGALNNTQFIDQLYRFTLNREADDLGRQVWVDRLNSGTTRAEMVVIFSESVEHVNLTAPTWQGGIRYENYVESSAALGEISGKDMDAFVIAAGLDGGWGSGALHHADDFQIALDTFPHATSDDRSIVVHEEGLLDIAFLSDLAPTDALAVGHNHSDWL